MNKKIIALLAFLFLINLGFVSSAHYITGIVEDAKDGESANGKTIVLWNDIVGIASNLTDTIGQDGNSGTDNIYMIDCEMLSPSCDVGDVLSLRVINSGDDYISGIRNVTVSGAGYTLADNITLNSIPQFFSVEIDDEFTPPIYPEGEIDLNAGDVREVLCRAVVVEHDGADSLENASARFFHYTRNYEDANNNNTHYSNESCFINKSYGTNTEAEVICSFNLLYYAISGDWNCTIEVSDNLSISSRGSNTTFVNELLAIYVNSTVDFGEIGADSVTNEVEIVVVNYGNTKINLSLSGYGEEEEDEYAMICYQGEIPVYYKKYNLTASNPGEMELEEFQQKYTNLSEYPVLNEFNLDYRIDELEESSKETYWRVYAPSNVGGDCEGHIIFGARKE